LFNEDVMKNYAWGGWNVEGEDDAVFTFDVWYWRWRSKYAWHPVLTRELGWVWLRPYWQYEERRWRFTDFTEPGRWCISVERWGSPFGRAMFVERST
jgi:hypothetical protein